MRMMNSKKGLVNGLLAFTIILFTIAIFGALALGVWNQFDGVIQGLDEGIASNYTKAQITENTQGIFLFDKIFVVLFIAFLIGYLITSFTLPVENKFLFIIFLLFLIVITFVGMLLSNTWTYLLSNPFFDDIQSHIRLTDFVLRYLPVITLLVGVAGAVIFYSKEEGSSSSINFGGGGGGFE